MSSVTFHATCRPIVFYAIYQPKICLVAFHKNHIVCSVGDNVFMIPRAGRAMPHRTSRVYQICLGLSFTFGKARRALESARLKGKGGRKRRESSPVPAFGACTSQLMNWTGCASHSCGVASTPGASMMRPFSCHYHSTAVGNHACYADHQH